MRASVVLAFYNDLPLLKMVLAALKAQYDGSFEVLIADDGSGPDVVRGIEAILNQYPFKLRHLWQPDEGFLKPVILNKAVQAARGDYLIFMDADCVPQRHFVSDHLREAAPGICQTGRRIDVFRDAIYELDCRQPEHIIRRNFGQLWLWLLRGKSRTLEKGLRLPSWLARQLGGRAWGALGCNFSVARQDLLAINGFDERHGVQWGAEDSDVERRLLKFGVKRCSLRYQAIMIHFDQSFFKRGLSEDAQRRWKFYQQAAEEDRVWTPHGLVKEDRPDPKRN
jgi:glycosyltransferase involved in cell wall biosynthesis